MQPRPDTPPNNLGDLGHVRLLLDLLQISQEAVKVDWYSHLFKNRPQFIVIYIVKGFGAINK